MAGLKNTAGLADKRKMQKPPNVLKIVKGQQMEVRELLDSSIV